MWPPAFSRFAVRASSPAGEFWGKATGGSKGNGAGSVVEPPAPIPAALNFREDSYSPDDWAAAVVVPFGALRYPVTLFLLTWLTTSSRDWRLPEV